MGKETGCEFTDDF